MHLSKTVSGLIAAICVLTSGAVLAADPNLWIVVTIPTQSWEKVGPVEGTPAGSLSVSVQQKDSGIKLDFIATPSDSGALDFAKSQLGPHMSGTKLSPSDIKGGDSKAYIGWDCKGKKASDPDETSLAIYRKVAGDDGNTWIISVRARWPKGPTPRDIEIAREIDGITTSAVVTLNPPKGMK